MNSQTEWKVLSRGTYDSQVWEESESSDSESEDELEDTQ